MFGGSGGKGIPAISRGLQESGRRWSREERKRDFLPTGRRFLEITEVERQNSLAWGVCQFFTSIFLVAVKFPALSV